MCDFSSNSINIFGNRKQEEFKINIYRKDAENAKEAVR